MAASAIQALATLTLGSTQGVVTFSSIPQTYGNLRLIITGGTTTGVTPSITINGIGGTSYDFSYIMTDGATNYSYGSAANSNISFVNPTPGTNVFSIDFLNYTSSTQIKPIMIKGGNGTNGNWALVAHLFSNTAAVTTIALTPSSGSWSIGTTFSLYGVSA